jgi:hypothetical protein
MPLWKHCICPHTLFPFIFLGAKPIHNLAVFYFAGIGVIAHHFHIDVYKLSAGDKNGFAGKVLLEPIAKWCDLDVGLNPFKAAKVEEYATALLAGLAANYVCAEARRGQIKRSHGGAGLEMKYLREIWQSLQPEPDRAIAIIFGSLGKFDDGDAEATTRRLWHRAVRLLRQPKLHGQLNRLARELKEKGRMTHDEIDRLLVD